MPQLLPMLERFGGFYGAKRRLFPDPAYAETFLTEVVTHHPFWVAEHVAGAIVGVIGGALATHPFNPDIVVLTEMFWWVDDTSRGARAGQQLLDTFLAFGRDHADWTVMTKLAHSPINTRCFTKRGGRLHEESWLFETPLPEGAV